MHEMSLMESVIGLVEDEARKGGFTRVKTVRLDVGELSSAMPDALTFCFDAVSRGTIAEGAMLEIVSVPGQGWCMDCSKTVPLSERFGACPDCGNYHVQMTSGDDLRLSELEVE
jgi:hydrogenase nickel incorporation protein HypA/HybF